MVRLTWLAIVIVAAGPNVPAHADTPADAELPPVLFSRQLMEAEGLAVGDTVVLSRNASGEEGRPFRIAGSYEPLPDPMRITSRRHEARLHLPDLLELTDDSPDPLFRESVSAINVALADSEDAEDFARDLTLKMPGLVVAPAGRPADGRNPFVVLERFHLAIALVTVLGSTAFLLALMVMRADERRETVGILRLIGFSRRRVLLEVFVEGLFVAVSGALFGLVLAAAMQGAFNRFFQWHYDTALIFVRVTAPIAWRCIAFAVPLGVLAGIVASWTLLRREVLELLRR
jgi:putative ABC transport system permease protein